MNQEPLSKEEFAERVLLTMLGKSIMSNQYALAHNEQVKFTKYYKHNLKRFGKLYTEELIKAEKAEFDLMDNSEEDAVTNIFNAMDRYFETVAKIPFSDFDEMILIHRAYAKDPKSLLGIAKKITK